MVLLILLLSQCLITWLRSVSLHGQHIEKLEHLSRVWQVSRVGSNIVQIGSRLGFFCSDLLLRLIMNTMSGCLSFELHLECSSPTIRWLLLERLLLLETTSIVSTSCLCERCHSSILTECRLTSKPRLLLLLKSRGLAESTKSTLRPKLLLLRLSAHLSSTKAWLLESGSGSTTEESLCLLLLLLRLTPQLTHYYYYCGINT
jgi:hypothetical protein